MSTSSPGAPALSCFTPPKVTPTMMTPCTSAAMNTVVVSRSRVGATPSRSCIARDISAFLGAYAALDSGNYHISDIEPELLVEFTNSCRTRDVDLGNESADDVDADEDHSQLRELGADLGRQPAIAVIEFASYAGRTRGEIPAVVGRQRDTCKCVRDWLAIDEQHTRIPGGADVRHVALRDGKPVAHVRQRLDDDGQILVALLGDEDGLAAHAVERLHDDLPVLRGERGDVAGAARDECGRAALREPRGENFLVHVTQPF